MAKNPKIKPPVIFTTHVQNHGVTMGSQYLENLETNH